MMTLLVRTITIALLLSSTSLSLADGPSGVAEIQSKHDRALIVDRSLVRKLDDSGFIDRLYNVYPTK